MVGLQGLVRDRVSVPSLAHRESPSGSSTAGGKAARRCDCQSTVRGGQVTKTARKFTDEEVAAIRASTKTLRELALEYGCSFSTIRNVRTRDYRIPCRRAA